MARAKPYGGATPCSLDPALVVKEFIKTEATTVPVAAPNVTDRGKTNPKEELKRKPYTGETTPAVVQPW